MRIAGGEFRVIGNEGGTGATGGIGLGRFEHLLDHRMTPFVDDQDIALIYFGARIIPFSGEGGPTGEHIDLGQSIGGGYETVGIRKHGGYESVKQILLPRQRIFFSVKDFLFLYLKCLRDVTLTAYRGLAPNVIFGHEVKVGLGHIDVIAKIVSEFHLQAFDAGALLFSRLEFR